MTVFAMFTAEEAVAEQRISVVGLGYIGLPTAVSLAEAGFQVTGVDVDPRVIEAVNGGRAHIVEPGLEKLLHSVVKKGRLTATRQHAPADAFLIAVPTPVGHDQYRTPDLTYVFAAAEEIARARGCIGIRLDTMSFQAPAFYRRLGYSEFGRIEDYPPGHTRLWFMKRL